MIFHKAKKYIAILCIICLTAGLLIRNPNAANEYKVQESEGIYQTDQTENNLERSMPLLTYRDYLLKHGDMKHPDRDIIINSSDYKELSDENAVFLESGLHDFEGIFFKDYMGFVLFEFDVPESGLYHFYVSYQPQEDDNYSAIRIGVELNGEYPFGTADILTLDRPWHNPHGFTTDERGNQILTPQIAVNELREQAIRDPEGRYNEPLYFYFDQGKNTIRLNAIRGDFILKQIRLGNEKELKTYEDLLIEHKQYSETSGYSIYIQAQEYNEKSDTMILPDFDKSDPATMPNHHSKLKFNIIPGIRYNMPGQWISWDVEIPESGFYNIHIKARQNIKSGVFVSRRLYINGEIPFKESDIIEFKSSNRWYFKTLGEENAPFNFYFEEGIHQLKLEVVPGSLAETTLILDDVIFRLNTLYRNVIMVAGTSPDRYRDYQLRTSIPGLMDELQELKDILENQERSIMEINEKAGRELNSMRTLINMLEVFLRDPDRMATMLNSFRNNVEALSAWLSSAKEQPLDLDYILIASPDEELPPANSSFIRTLIFNIRRLISSYAEDYGIVGDYYEEEEALTVWTGMGRDQLQIIKDLIDNEFVKQKGVKVNISLVPVGIREAVMANRGPDVALFLSSDEPMNLAIRNALVDLSQFDTFNEVRSRFMEGATTPFEISGGCYALPLTEIYPMLFVRTDIFEELNLEVPDTWEDMHNIASALQRRNMDIGIPATIGTFATILFQNEGEFFNEDRSRTMFDSGESFDAFTQWTEFFSQYSFPLQYDFYARFRTGEMPIGIAPYVIYTMFNVAAPEINNRWSMFPMPGVAQSDGSINRTVSISNATGIGATPGLDQGISSAIILDGVKNKQAAWDFLDWFTTTEIQTRFGQSQEAVMGPLGRYPTANVEAFKRLPWSLAEQSVLIGQWENVRRINEIPGNYYVTRELNNAFRRVIYYYDNPVDTLNRYNVRINREIERRRRDFGLDYQ